MPPENKKEKKPDYYYILNQLGHDIQHDYVKLFPVTNRNGNCLKQFSDVVEELKKKWMEEVFEEVESKFCGELFGLSVNKKYYCPNYKKRTKLRVHWNSYTEKLCGSCQILKEIKIKISGGNE